jgi:hypothetical protein
MSFVWQELREAKFPFGTNSTENDRYQGRCNEIRIGFIPGFENAPNSMPLVILRHLNAVGFDFTGNY